MMLGLMALLFILERAAALVAISPTTADRLSLRSELLTLLRPDGPPHALAGRAAELVEALELLEAVPATPGFLSLGAAGDWTLVATQDAPERNDAPPGADAVPPAVELISAQQTLDFTTERAYGKVEFRVVDDDLCGALELDAICAQDAMRCDTLNFVTTARRLKLPRAPSCPVPAMLEAVHAQLSHDFLGDEGVRLGLQTTYLDEQLRITRCTTRELAGSCAVHLRASPPPE